MPVSGLSEPEEIQETEVSEVEVNQFEIKTDLLHQEHTVRRNETLSTILGAYHFSPRMIHDITRASSGTFDVRRIRPGRTLHIFSETDSLSNKSVPKHIVYNESITDYIRFDLGDSIVVQRNSRPVETNLRLIEGEITTSLYHTLREQGVSPQLTNRLASVFAWQVDFYRIQSGDRIRVLFEERSIDGEVIGPGNIKSAYFHHRNNDFYAFHFRQNGLDEYFDENGNSLRRQFMAAPLEYTRISSHFTNRRYHPVLQRHMPHHGIDYAAPTGTPVRAVGDGVVIVARYDRNNGNFVRIRHNSIYETGYLHLSRFGQGIRSGTEVKQGQIIGYVGATGLATGPHLCFRFWEHGRPVNPQSIDLPPAEPIEREYFFAFLERKDQLLLQMEINPDSVLTRPIPFALNIGYNGVMSFTEEDVTDL
ncbi:peptidoglycan DD-metalloendopeptidase family protein [Balneolaceae bacterium ANBcel3]|nr:peptidoglycan DD-metalloendopeptidase family protein [Balneolaceae bacterium ANBcel3]